jgi:uncharacterized protein (UPF0548 family)
VLRLRRPSPESVRRILSEARDATPTYPEIGATNDRPLPAGYRHDEYRIVVGEGQAVFERAVQALRSWQAQLGAGIEVLPADAWVGRDETIVLLIRASGLWATAPCRVVYIIEEPDRFVFAYGTLPGHPERGEVAFAVTLEQTGEVDFRVWSFSHPVDPLARLGAPLTRRIQKLVTHRYLTAVRELARADGSPL